MHKVSLRRIIPVVLALVLVGTILWYNHLCDGKIDISDSAPTREMLLHIIRHADALIAREDLFSAITSDDGSITIQYIGNPELETALFSFTPNAAALLGQAETELYVSGSYWRDNASEFWNIVTPGSQLNVKFFITSADWSEFFFSVYDYDALDASDAPLREMLTAMEDIIGSP